MSLSESFIQIALFSKKLLARFSEKYDLTHQQVVLLHNIPTLDGISISELSNRLGVDISTLSRNLKKMEEKKLTTRSKCVNDNRVYKVFITTKAEEIVSLVLNDFDLSMSKILDSMQLSTSSSFTQKIESISWELYKLTNDKK
tara:strand:+ start:1034 stop:1462 length:429 start_codon:yes stop_codon:yes gene_type:complete